MRDASLDDFSSLSTESTHAAPNVFRNGTTPLVKKIFFSLSFYCNESTFLIDKMVSFNGIGYVADVMLCGGP